MAIRAPARNLSAVTTDDVRKGSDPVRLRPVWSLRPLAGEVPTNRPAVEFLGHCDTIAPSDMPRSSKESP